MKKLIALILAALLVAALFAGCKVNNPVAGTESKKSSDPTSATPNPTEPYTTQAPAEPVVTEPAPIAPAGADSLIGTWVWEYEGVGEIMRFTFAADGFGTLESFGESMEFTYKVSGNVVDMTVEGETDSCPFSISGDTLTLTIEGEQIELVRSSGTATTGSRPSGASGDGLVGTWVWEYEGLGELMTFIFNADGTGYIDSLGEVADFTYTVSGDTIYMTHEGDTESVPFSLVGDTLILDIDGEEVELIRK